MARVWTVVQRFEVSFLRWLGFHPPNGFAGALVCDFTAEPQNANRAAEHDVDYNSAASLLDSIFDSTLWAVPKFRVSLERRMTRRMGGKNHFETFGLPKKNIVACLECGHWHEKHTICGHCYSKVREETKQMQEAMGEEATFYAPQTEMTFLYDGEQHGKDTEDSHKNKFVVEMKKKRPEWFSKSLLTKVNSS